MSHACTCGLREGERKGGRHVEKQKGYLSIHFDARAGEAPDQWAKFLRSLHASYDGSDWDVNASERGGCTTGQFWMVPKKHFSKLRMMIKNDRVSAGERASIILC